MKRAKTKGNNELEPQIINLVQNCKQGHFRSNKIILGHSGGDTHTILKMTNESSCNYVGICKHGNHGEKVKVEHTMTIKDMD